MESTAEGSSGNKWLSSDVVTRTGTIEEVRQFIPTFERRTFGPALLSFEEAEGIFAEAPPAQFHGFNPLYDVIVRKPLADGELSFQSALSPLVILLCSIRLLSMKSCGPSAR